MKTKAFCTIYNSKSDMYGNRYWAANWSDVKTGKEVKFKADHGSNVETISKHMYGNVTWNKEVKFVNVELGIRDFNKMTKTWPYYGCTGEDMAKRIKKELNGV